MFLRIYCQKIKAALSLAVHDHSFVLKPGIKLARLSLTPV